eukprot:Phypoly_transcript_03366.p1 GENE.Phypoly_transcript_03366~~Phypoly_transcript_03366.p1  ORF type:complete len:625 (+),score=67.14 Phypoly_transcript_03366:582-2456(+)
MAAAAAMWPWDILLTEAGFLALFLPASGLPHPVVAFAYRWLMFRLMLGFGKLKFMGCTRNDNLYIREFFTAQPIPSRSGFYLQRLPDLVHKLSLVFFFVSEIPNPFSFIYPLSWPWGIQVRLIGALMNLGLQIAIFISGNFGFFNPLTAVLCIPLFDVYNVAPSLEEMAHVLMLLFPLSILALVFNTWMNLSWYFWPSLRFLDPIRRFYRFLQPFTIVNAYGVFPPHSVPKERFMPIIEGSADGKTWKEYEYKYLTKLPWVLSPYHPRFEYTFFYTFMGGFDNLFCSLTATDPYHFSKFPLHHRIAQRLLEGASPAVRRIFHSDPFPNAPPKFVRVAVYMFEPQQMNSKTFYKRTYMHMQQPAVQSAPHMWDDWVISPYMWHFDLVVWRDRFERIWGERKVHTPLPLFWEFMSQFQFNASKCAEKGWDNVLRNQVHKFRSYTKIQQRQLENELGKYTWMLMKKLDPMLPILAARTPCTSYSYLGLLAHIIISKGHDEVMECLKPGGEHRIEQIAKKFTFERAMFLFTLFWYDMVRFQAIKFRLMTIVVVRDESPSAAKFIPGFLSKEFMAWLSSQFIPTPGEDEENVPLYLYDENGWTLQGVRKLETSSDMPEPSGSAEHAKKM